MGLEQALAVLEVHPDEQRAGLVLAHDEAVVDVPRDPAGMSLARAAGERRGVGVDLVEVHGATLAARGA